MSIYEATNTWSLKNLLAEVNTRTMVLPDFQRDFVWDPWMTQELIVSIANNFPAGSLLRVRDRDRVFAVREFQGAPKLDNSTYTFLVLDGQQRLTSLYQAFYGVGEHRYYLNIQKLIDGAEFEESIFHLRTNTKRVIELEKFDVQVAEKIVPLSVLKVGSGGFGKWSKKVARTLDGDARNALDDSLDEIENRWIQVVDDYHFPVVTLSDTTGTDALCTIFETLNRTGVKLTVFELLTARFWKDDIRLRESWEIAQAEFPIIKEFAVDPLYLLQAIALLSRHSPSCKKSDLLALSASDHIEWWPKVVAALAEGLTILREDCGAALPKWLPYNTMLVPLTAVIAKAGSVNSADSGARREKIRKWFWCSVFGQAYENAPNSQAAKDTTELLVWFAGGVPPEVITGLRFDPNTLRDVTPRQRAIYRGTISLILSNRARDFHTHSVITGKLINEEGIDDHHIFPADFLIKNRGVDAARRRDCILNRTLIDRTTNQIITNRAPSDYLGLIREKQGVLFDSILESHYLPTGENSPFSNDDYESFLTWRQDRLWREIMRVTGVTNASDLEDENTILTVVSVVVPETGVTEAAAEVSQEWQTTGNMSAPELTGLNDFDVINKYGHHFDGYEKFGSFERLAKIAGKVEKRFQENGIWEGTTDELRGTLFFMLRRHRHGSMEGMEILSPDGGVSVVPGMDDRELEALRSLYKTILDQWDKVGSS